MERTSGLFGIADYVVVNRKRVTFLDGVAAMIDWKRIENCSSAGLADQ